MKQEKNAFTLAEVLITLFILGIIAVITLPRLTNAFNEKATKTAVIKTVNQLEEAIVQVIFTEDEVESTNILQDFTQIPFVENVGNDNYRIGKQVATFTFTKNEENNGETNDIFGTIVVDGNGPKPPNALVQTIGDGNDQYTFNIKDNGTITPADDIARQLISNKK